MNASYLVQQINDLKLQVGASKDLTLSETIVQTEEAIKNSMLVIGAAVLIGSFLALITGRAISVPVKRMTKAMQNLAQNDLEIEIPALTKKDEVGAMARAVQVFKENAIKVEASKHEEIERTVRVKQRTDEMNRTLRLNIPKQ